METGNVLLHRVVSGIESNRSYLEIRTYEAKKIPSGYMIWSLYKDGQRDGKTGRRIGGVSGKPIVNHEGVFSFFGSIYCWEDQIEESKEILLGAINDSMGKYQKLFDEVKDKVWNNFKQLEIKELEK